MSVYSIIAKVNPETAILRLLKDNPDGVSKGQIRVALKSSRKFVDDLITSLKKEGSINERIIGRAKVYYNG